jgi:hypothetical protein
MYECMNCMKFYSFLTNAIMILFHVLERGGERIRKSRQSNTRIVRAVTDGIAMKCVIKKKIEK